MTQKRTTLVAGSLAVNQAINTGIFDSFSRKTLFLALLFLGPILQPPAGFAASEKDGVQVQVLDRHAALRSVAILPLKASSDSIREFMTVLCEKAVEETLHYELLDPAQLAEKAGLPLLALAALSDKQAVEIGSRVGVDAVLVGSVSRFALESTPVIHMQLQLITCPAGKQVWTADCTERSRDAAQKLPDFAEAVVRDVIQQVGIRLPEAAASAESIPDSATDPVPLEPEPPVEETLYGFSVSEIGLREVSFRWARTEGAWSKFRIERSISPLGPFEVLATVAPNRRFFRDHSSAAAPLRDDTTYYYRLTPLRSDKQEGDSAGPLIVTTAPPPAPPAELGANASASRQVQLQWAASTSDGVVAYIIERAAAAPGAAFTRIASVRGLHYYDGGRADSELADSTEYLYRIACVNRVGAEGARTEPVSVTTLPTPDPIRKLAAEDGVVRAVPVTWVANKETNVVAYHMYRTDSEDGELALLKVIPGRNSTRFVDGGNVPGNLPDAKTYYYMVRAVNSVGAQSPPSEVIRATTRDVPPVVQHLAAVSDQPRQVSLSWEESPDAMVTGYEIWRAIGDNDHFALVGASQRKASNSFVDRGGTRRSEGLGLLLDGTQYRYKVLALNTARVPSGWSGEVAARTKLAPAIPRDVQATTFKPKAVEVRWSANAEKDIASYQIEIGTRPGTLLRGSRLLTAEAGQATISYLDKGLIDGMEKYYRVKAMDHDGLESGWTEYVMGQSKPTPDMPRNLRAHVEETGIQLVWDAPPAQDVRVYRIWSQNLLKWELFDTTLSPEYRFQPSQIARRTAVFAVTAIDQDGLESNRGEPFRLDKNLLY